MGLPANQPDERRIRLLQEKLSIRITGVFDADTIHALREFQAHHGLNVTGEANEETNALLFSASEDAETWMNFREHE